MFSCSHCQALHFLTKRVLNSSSTNPKFSECCIIASSVSPSYSEPPDIFLSFFSEQTPAARYFPDSIHSYNRVLSIRSVATNLVTRGPDLSAFNPTTTLHEQIYHYIGDRFRPPRPFPTYVSIYVDDTDFG